jgi:hypothetical protein
MAECAFCGEMAALTREHLWPSGLHRRLQAVNRQTETSMWLRRADKELASEPIVKDVCATCNNITLSKLDDYICELFDRQFVAIFVAIPQRHDEVPFEYEYHRLKRWLLKICFNSARIHSSIDLFAFAPLLPYILGRSESPGRSVRLYVQLSYPGEVPASELADPSLGPFVFAPLENRLGHMLFETPVDRKVLRAVHLRAFSFFLAFFQPGEKVAGMDYFERHFLERNRHVARLKPSRSTVTLVCDGMNAWEAVKEARANSFFDDC